MACDECTRNSCSGCELLVEPAEEMEDYQDDEYEGYWLSEASQGEFDGAALASVYGEDY